MQNGNQNHLDVEMKLKPRSSPVPFNPPMELKDELVGNEETAPKKKDESEILISNLYTKDQLAPFFQKKTLYNFHYFLVFYLLLTQS